MAFSPKVARFRPLSRALATPTIGVMMNTAPFMLWGYFLASKFDLDRCIQEGERGELLARVSLIGMIAYLISFLTYGAGVCFGIMLGIGEDNADFQ